MPPPKPGSYIAKLKAKNRRKAKQSGKTIGQVLSPSSGGGRTASEAGLAKSVAASGKKVSRTNRQVGKGQPKAIYRAPGAKAPRTISETQFDEEEPKRRAKQMESGSTRSALTRISGQDKDTRQLRKANQRVRRTRAKAESNWITRSPDGKAPAKLVVRTKTPEEDRRDRRRYQKAKKARRKLKTGRAETQRTIRNTAVDIAAGYLEQPGGRKQLPELKKALKTQQGQEQLVEATVKGDIQGVRESGETSRFTGVNPYKEADESEARARKGARRLKRRGKQIESLEKRIKRKIDQGDSAEAQRLYRKYERKLSRAEGLAKRTNRNIARAEKQARAVTRAIARGELDSTVKMEGEGANRKIELPSVTFENDQVKKTVEEGFGLGLSPIDIGTNISGVGVAFKLGKGGLGAARGAAAGAKAAKTASDTTLTQGIVKGLAGSGTKTGKVGAAFLKASGSPTAQKLRRGAFRTAGAGVLAETAFGEGRALNFIESQADAVISDPMGVASTGVRNLLGGIAALPTVGANLAVTGKRGVNVPFTSSPNQKTSDYVFKPTTQMAEAMFTEFKEMVDVYTSNDKERMKEATIEDYGIAPLFATYFMTRPFMTGTYKALGKSGELVTLPSYGTGRNLPSRVAGIRGTTYFAKTDINNAVASVTERLVGSVGLDNPFSGSGGVGIFTRDKGVLSRPDPATIMGRETIPQIRQRRQLAARAFRDKSRSDAMESTMNSVAVEPFVQASQRYNSAAWNPVYRGAHKDVENILDEINGANEAATRAAGLVGPARPPITAQHLGVFLATTPLTRANRARPDDPEAPRDLIDENLIREFVSTLPDGSADAITGRALLALLDRYGPESKQRQLIVDLANGAWRSGQIKEGLEVGRVMDNVPEPEQAAKLRSNENARMLETVIAYERVSGEPAPARPEVAIDQLIDEMKRIAGDEALDLAEKKKQLARLSGQAVAARRAIEQRDIQRRITIKRAGLRGRLVDAAERADKHKRNYYKAEATQWMIDSGDFRSMLTARLRDIAGNIKTIEANRRKRSERKGELKAREQEEGRRKRKGESELSDTREKANRVMKDQIDDEPAEAQLLRDLRAEQAEIRRQITDIENLRKEVKREMRLYQSAERKVLKLRQQIDTPVSPTMRKRAENLTAEQQLLQEFVNQQEELLRPYMREITAALTPEEITAIVKRVKAEVDEEFGTELSTAQWQRALSAKKERLNKELSALLLEKESYRPITKAEAEATMARRAEVADEIEGLRAELAMVLTALREGAGRGRASRDFDAAQGAMPDRPSGRPYRPGEGRTPEIEGRTQVLERMADEILEKERELERLNARLAAPIVQDGRRSSFESAALKDIDESIAGVQLALSAIDTRLRVLRPQDIAALNPKRIRQARTSAAIGVATEAKRRDALAEDMEARQALYDKYAEEAFNAGWGEAVFLSGRPAAEITGVNAEIPNVSRGLGMSYEKKRSGSLIRSGNVDRSPKRFMDFINETNKAQARERTSQGLLTQAYRTEGPDGEQRIEMTREEADMLVATGQIDGDQWVWMPVNMFYEPEQFNRMFNSLKAGASAGDINEYVKTNLPNPNESDVKLPSGESQVAAAKLAEGAGVRGVLLPPQSVRMVIDSEKKLNGFNDLFQKINKISSRLVLGTSVSWMLAQPIAEFLILVLDQPNPRRLLRGYLQAKEMRKTADGRRIMAMLSGQNYGMARSLRSSDRLQQDYDAAIKALNRMPITELAAQAARLETLGRFDRWKGAWIREIGAAAELDRELSTLRRASKAFMDNKDVIEKHANKLLKMSPTERLRWTGTREGTAVADRIAKNIDDMLGNWTDVAPGAETTAGSVVFFYPFVRFSMRWTFDTFPKRHPVRASLAQIYGALNAEMLEHWLNFDPAWLSDWAAAPVFGGTDEQPIVSLVGLNRVSPSGNAFLEYGALSENPLFNLTKVMPPLFGIGGRAVFGRDPYGKPLVNPGSTFGVVDPPGLGTIARQALDEGINLIAPARSAVRQTGYTPSKVIEKGDWKRPLNLITGKGIPDKRYQGQIEKPGPGDDQNVIRDLLRREAIALLPKPVNYYKTEQVLKNLYELRTNAQKDAALPYPKVTYRGRVQSLADAKERIERERRRATEETQGMSMGWNPTAEQKRIIKQAKDISEKRKEGERWKEIAEESIVRLYRDQQLTLGQESKIRQAVLGRQRQQTDSIKSEWQRRVEGEMWASLSYPGEKKAAEEIKDLDALDEVEKGMSSITGPVSTNGTPAARGKETPRRQKLVDTLRQSTRGRLEEAGMRKVNLADPTLDPATIVKKTDEGNVVVRYRGKKVLGKMPLKAVRQAEQNNTLDVDEDGLLTIPETRQAVARAEKLGQQVVKQKKKVDQLAAKTGGVPSGVPKKYRGLIRKWGAYLETEMAKNNLVGVRGGLPDGMSGAEYLAKIIQAESNWDERIGHPDNTSSAQAQGLGQFIPSTRQSFLEKFGVDAYAGPDEQIKAAAFHLDGSHDTQGGLESYNPGFPEKVAKDGTWSYYLDQDVGELVVPNNEAAQKAKQAEKQLGTIQDELKKARQTAADMGIEIAAPSAQANGSYPAKQAKKLSGPWAGTEGLLDMANGSDFEISSTKRTPEKNASVGGSSTSDHLTTNPNSFAHDLPTTDVNYGNQILEKYHKRLKLNEPLQTTGTHNYTSRKYPGYTFQFIWQDSGHYDHVHIGARYTGEDLPAGTFGGPAPGASYGGGGGSVGGSVGGPGGGPGGGPMAAGAMPGVQAPTMAPSQSKMETPSLAEIMAEVNEEGEGDVKSVGETVDALPSVQARKKKSLRFDPRTRI